MSRGFDFPRWVQWLVYGLGIALVVGSLWYMAWAYQRVWAANDWPSATGRIETSGVRTDTSTDSDGDTSTSYYPEVAYSYQVNGRTYRNDDLWLVAATGYSDPEEATGMIAGYPVGREIEVFYNPDAPGDAALLYDDPPLAMLFVTLMGFGWLAGGWFMFGKRRKGRGLGMGTGRVKPQPTHEPCRKCRTPLRIDEHRQITGYETVTQQVWDENLGRSRTETYTTANIRHVPCPSCGEPKPLNSWRMKLPMIIFLTLFVGIWVAGIYLIFFLD